LKRIPVAVSRKGAKKRKAEGAKGLSFPLRLMSILLLTNMRETKSYPGRLFCNDAPPDPTQTRAVNDDRCRIYLAQ
jgi:hypothetical protein